MVVKKTDEEQVSNEMPEVMPTETPEMTGEMAAEEMTEEPGGEMEAAPSGLIAILQKYLPDQEITEENKDELALQVIDKLSGIQDNLIEIADEYPEFAMFLSDIMKGMPLEEAAARNFDDMLTPPEGAPDWENINKGREARKSMLSEKKTKLETLEKNKQVSIDNAKAVIDELGLQEADAIKFLDWYDALNKDQFDGLISPAHLKALYKAYTFDDMVAAKDAEISDVSETSKIAGRNEQIEKKKINAESGDGIPKLTTSAKPAVTKKPTYAGNFMKGVI